MRQKSKRRIKRKRKKLLVIFSLTFLFLGTIFTLFIYKAKLQEKVQFLTPLGAAKKEETKIVTEALSKRNILAEKIVVASDSSVLIFLTSGGQAVISSKKNIDEQISSLQLILSRLTIEGKHFSVLDFRFVKPIITFQLP